MNTFIVATYDCPLVGKRDVNARRQTGNSADIRVNWFGDRSDVAISRRLFIRENDVISLEERRKCGAQVSRKLLNKDPAIAIFQTKRTTSVVQCQSLIMICASHILIQSAAPIKVVFLADRATFIFYVSLARTFERTSASLQYRRSLEHWFYIAAQKSSWHEREAVLWKENER